MMANHNRLSDPGGNRTSANTESAVFGRDEELAQLRQRFTARRSFLFHGPAGVGKTLLLRLAIPGFTDVLYSPHNPTPQALYRHLAQSLLELQHPVLSKGCPSGMASLQEKTAVGVKGLVRDALHNSQYLVVVDHLVRPSQALAAAIRELMLNWSVPVVAVSRSAHMEDTGFVLPLFPERAEKVALRNFDPEIALCFAVGSAEGEGLTAENLNQFLNKIVEYSAGNPGAILRLIQMAKTPKYVRENQIKITPLYIDYKIAMVSQ
jgi:hypothetical protein